MAKGETPVFRHPNVIAALILGGAVVLSSVLICIFIHSLDSTLQSKPMVGSGSSVSFPDHLTIGNGNSYFDVRIRTEDGKPLLVKQVP